MSNTIEVSLKLAKANLKKIHSSWRVTTAAIEKILEINSKYVRTVKELMIDYQQNWESVEVSAKNNFYTRNFSFKNELSTGD